MLTFDVLAEYSANVRIRNEILDFDRHVVQFGPTLVTAELLEQQEALATTVTHFDVFLSHSYTDVKLNRKRILQIKSWLETKHQLAVYIDWIVDPLLPRQAVTPITAAILRKRMRQSDSLFFATSTNSASSKWMPWELGFKDGDRNRHQHAGRCAILPVVDQSTTHFQGQEYLGLYPCAEESNQRLVVTAQPVTPPSNRVPFADWCRRGVDP